MRKPARNGNVAKRQDAIYKLLSSRPGLNYVQVANKLGIGRQDAYMAISGMDRRGMLLYEDDDGGLYRYDKA